MRKYFVIAAKNIKEFESRVNEVLDKGYEPQGGMTAYRKVINGRQHGLFCQAVYRKED